MVGHEKPELWRGMKVRSSVKKLCDGCKVGHVCLLEDWEKELTVRRLLSIECQEERICLYYMLEESEA